MPTREADLAFPLDARLSNSREFRAVFARATRHADRYFTLLVGEGQTDRPRLGLAVSRKAAPRAVDRNRLKRLIRERFRHWQPDLPQVDIVVMVRPIARQADNATLMTALDRLWQRVSRSCAPS